MGHLKRLNAPMFWPVKRRGYVWVAKPSPGPHKVANSMPLVILIRDILKLADNSKEARSIIKQGKVFVDRKERKDPNYPLGLMDSVEIPEAKAYIRMVVGEGGLQTVNIKHEETAQKLCRIEDKKTLSGGQTQLNLHDGRNVLAGSEEYKPGDTLLIGLTKQDILEHYKFETGSPVSIIAGKNAGVKGVVVNIQPRKTLLEQNKIVVQTVDGRKIETLKKYAMTTGKAGTSQTTSEEKPKTKKKGV